MREWSSCYRSMSQILLQILLLPSVSHEEQYGQSTMKRLAQRTPPLPVSMGMLREIIMVWRQTGLGWFPRSMPRHTRLSNSAIAVTDPSVCSEEEWYGGYKCQLWGTTSWPFTYWLCVWVSCGTSLCFHPSPEDWKKCWYLPSRLIRIK